MTTATEFKSNPQTHARILQAALAILDQGERLLGTVSPESYTEKMPVAFNASIGGHYRHCLDHFTSFQRALDHDLVDYDHRDRDLHVETDPAFARQLTRQLRAALAVLPPEMLARPIAVRTEVSYAAGEAPVTASSLGRELAYVIAHAIHHYALIAVMARMNGVWLEADFGLAPSTAAFEKAGGRP